MDIWEIDKLYLFLIFVIPGFICLKTYSLISPTNEQDSSKLIIDAVAYSCINYGLLFLPIISIESSSLKDVAPTLYKLFYFFVLFISPVLLAFAWKKLRSTSLFQKNAPHPTLKPWDWLFAQREPYWMKIIKKDGSIVAGKYSAKSFASSSPAEEQIYIEEVWLLNEKGGYERIINQTAGAIIMSSEISHIELRTLTNQEIKNAKKK